MRTVAIVAAVVSLSPLLSAADAQHTAILRKARAIKVLPMVASGSVQAQAGWQVMPLLQAELRLALRTSNFEIVDEAPIAARILLLEHSGCRPVWVEWICVGGATEARLVLLDQRQNELASIPIRVSGRTFRDRIGPQTDAMEDWEYFATVQNKHGGSRFRTFYRKLKREIARLR